MCAWITGYMMGLRMATTDTTYRLLLWLEGMSLLVLLFVAMPLKYAADLPIVVRVVGSLHGLLFVLLVLALFRATRAGALTRRGALWALALATIPFGFLAVSRAERRAASGCRPRPAG